MDLICDQDLSFMIQKGPTMNISVISIWVYSQGAEFKCLFHYHKALYKSKIISHHYYYCVQTLTRPSWIRYTDCWIVN